MILKHCMLKPTGERTASFIINESLLFDIENIIIGTRTTILDLLMTHC